MISSKLNAACGVATPTPLMFISESASQVKELPPKWGLLWAIKGQVIVKREARGHPERNLLAEVLFLSSMLRRAQIRIGTRPLSEWLRVENRLEAKRGISPVKTSAVKVELNG